MVTLNIGKDFSPDPLGRYRSDGDSSGEAFREDCLRPALNKLKPGETLKIILDDDVVGYGSSFLSEGFSGIVRYGYFNGDELLSKIELSYTDPDFEFYKNRIVEYVTKASFKSREYVPTEPAG